jgi:hypothetical protein
MTNVARTWVIYSTPQKNEKPLLVMCEQAEWDAIEADRPGRNSFVKGGFLSESEAERFMRGELDAALRMAGNENQPSP